MLHGSAVLALTGCAVLGTGQTLCDNQCLVPQGRQAFFLHWKLSPEIQEWFLKKARWVYAKPLSSLRSQTEFSLVCSVLLPFCHLVPGDTTTARFRLPKSLWRRTLEHITGKTVPNVIYDLLYPLSAFCVSSLCQEFLKSVLWLWHWGRRVRQIVHTHTRALRANQTSGI